ncbi:MAG TPA: CDGSH iron-sulfur domain-containing protein, partial [Anaerolineales bacterium]|nr:CDGSH iron-sulfur domain-containing protein [Anaerolineales bacterium]
STTINPRLNGPLYVRGHMRIMGSGGSLIREDTRVALCRCGHSENKPFCDGSHRKVGFRSGTTSEGSR